MAPASDPWQWTVDDVVSTLCQSRELWNDRPGSTLPDTVTLERSLRDNDVNGSTLLNDVTKDVLRDDFGIASLGQRSAITWAIEQLRDRSDLYLTEQRRSTTRQQSYFSLAAPVAGFKREWNSAFPETPVASNSGDLFRTVSEAPPSGGANTPVIGSNLRPNEVAVQDQEGRKRRKLDLRIAQPQDAATGEQQISAVEKTFQDYSKNKGLRYLSSKIAVDRLFFGTTKFGEELLDDEHTSTPQDPLDPQNFNLSFISTRAAGAQQFVASRLQHFLGKRRQQEFVTRRGNKALMIHPYVQTTPTKSARKAVMLVESINGQAVTTKDDTIHVQQDLPHDGDSNSSDNQWDFLLKWQDKEKQYDSTDIFDTAIQSVKSDDISEGLAGELLEEESEHDGTMNQATVSELIDETLHAYAEEWRSDENHVDDRKAWKVWQKDSRKYSRSQRIDFAKSLIRSFDSRIRDQKSYLLRDTYKNAHEVRKCCENSRVTVEDRELEKFKIEVLKRSQPPPKPRGQPVRKVKSKPTQSADGDDIVIDIESEDDVSDFIEEDDFPGPSDERPASVVEDNDHEVTPALDPAPISNDSHVDVGVDSTTTTIVNEHGQLPETEAIDSLSANPKTNALQSGDDQAIQTASANIIRSNASEKSERPGNAIPALLGNVNEADIEDWDMTDIEEESQRTKLLLKLLLSLHADQYQSLRSHVIASGRSIVVANIYDALKVFAKHASTIPSTTDFDLTLKLAHLFFAWHECRYEEWLTVQSSTAQNMLDSAAIGRSIADFMTLIVAIFERFPRPLGLDSDGDLNTPQPPNPALSEDEGEDLSDDSEEEPPFNSPRKVVKVDPKAQLRRQKARKREIQSQAATQRLLQSQSQDLSLDDGGPLILLNVEEEDEHAQVFISPYIARKMQPHQVEGVRFMWREVVTGATSEKDGGEGCLLAHTMGLGKTMQA